MRLIALLVLLSAAPAVWSQAAGAGLVAADALTYCGQHAAQSLRGLAALEAECPGVTQALEDAGYLAFLSPAQRDQLAPPALLDLAQMQERYREPDASNAIDVAALEPILDSLDIRRSERPLTWFERFKRWLRTLFERQQQDSDNWLLRWLEKISIPDRVSKAILFGSILLVIALALAVLINELRIAGVFRRRRGQRPGSADAAAGSLAMAGADINLDAIPAETRAPLLLRMLVATLVKSGRLRTERSLTHRELGLRAQFDDARQRECFRQVADLAERVVYGGGRIAAEEFEPIVAAGRALHLQLAGAAT